MNLKNPTGTTVALLFQDQLRLVSHLVTWQSSSHVLRFAGQLRLLVAVEVSVTVDDQRP